MVTSVLTAESTSRFADVKGIRVHYNEAGSPSAPALIMLHGGGPGASGWSNFNPNIGPLSEQYHVLAVDELGYGQTDYVPPTEPFPTANARMLRDLMDQLGIEKATPVGNSNGGAISMALAIDYPERVDKLVLMGANVGGLTNFIPMPTEGLKALFRARRNPTRETMRDVIQLMVYDSSFLTDELLEQRLQAALATHRPETYDVPVPMREMSQELGKIQAKTLVIWGRDDRVVPLDWSLKALWGIPNATLVVFSKCGHWAQLEHADEFNRLVIDFLSH